MTYFCFALEGYLKKPDFETISVKFINEFRNAKLGKVVLDDLDAFTDFQPCDLNGELKENEKFERSNNRSS